MNFKPMEKDGREWIMIVGINKYGWEKHGAKYMLVYCSRWIELVRVMIKSIWRFLNNLHKIDPWCKE